MASCKVGRPERLPRLLCRGGAERIRKRREKIVGKAASTEMDRMASVVESLERVVESVRCQPSARERYKELIMLGQRLDRLGEDETTVETRVMGCTAQVWVKAELDQRGALRIRGESDSQLSRGLVALLAEGLGGHSPAHVASAEVDFVSQLGLSSDVMPRSRANGMLNMVETIKRQARQLANGASRVEPFPSLLVRRDGVEAKGAFAEMQARYLEPDPERVDSLVSKLHEKRMAVVAHFYMDPEVQGALAAARERWPHIHISDSLAMADAAVRMVEGGCQAIAVLGVDFMSENVRAILDEAGYSDIPVYRMAQEEIGCSLAEAAESPSYDTFLADASRRERPVHVVYINTSLRTKARADAVVPTVTCTSSNVLTTILQAASQIPDANIFYGPDTYMGRNLQEMIRNLAEMPDEEIQQIHPAHTAESVRSLLPRLHTFHDGTCIVHDMFGEDVCKTLREAYSDAYLTAHFEVPGDMFNMALEAQKRGMGIVGSTSNLLSFIGGRIDEALRRSTLGKERLQFVLGTESGMVTSIVNLIKEKLSASENGDNVEAEVVFPVSTEAISETAGSNDLSFVPGQTGGEGCSVQGGCANCPYMKMNNLRALEGVLDLVDTPNESLLEGYKPRAYQEPMPDGRSIAEAGGVPILRMRHFSQKKELPEELVDEVTKR